MKKTLAFLALTFGGLFFALLIGLQPVVAQENSNLQAEVATPAGTDSATASESSALSPTAQPIDWQEEIAVQEKILRGQLEEYRDSYKSFLVAKDQYQKLETLKSIEDATQAWQLVMIKRSEVMQSYFRLLDLHLRINQGLDNERKQDLINRLATAQQALAGHQQTVKTASNRQILQALSNEYLELSEVWENIAYTTLAWLNYGKLAAVYMEAERLHPQAAEQINYLKRADQKEQQRAMQEVELVLEEAKQQLAANKANLEELTQEKELYKQNYSIFTQKLDPAFSSLNKVLAYYQELVQLYG